MQLTGSQVVWFNHTYSTIYGWQGSSPSGLTSQHRKWATEYPHSSCKRQIWKKLLLYRLPLSSHKIRSFIFYERVNLATLPNSFMLQLQLHYQSKPSALCMIGATPHTPHIPHQCLTIIQGNITVKRPGNSTTKALIHVISFCAALCRPNCTQDTQFSRQCCIISYGSYHASPSSCNTEAECLLNMSGIKHNFHTCFLQYVWDMQHFCQKYIFYATIHVVI